MPGVVKKLKASEIFAKVDPHLTVINSGRRKRSKNLWAATGGAICPRCGQEAVRFRPLDGVCWLCARAQDEKQVRDGEKHTKLKRHIMAHNARIDKRKRAG